MYRRYSEFLALCEQLKTKGYVVPEMPPKRMIGSFDPGFVMQRQQNLELWIWKLLTGKVISERAAREWSTVVIVIVIPLLMSSIESYLSNKPKQCILKNLKLKCSRLCHLY